MTATGSALKLKFELAELGRRHNVKPVPHTLPLAPPTGCSMLVKGSASTGDVDFDPLSNSRHSRSACCASRRSGSCTRMTRTKLRARLKELSYDAHGRLMIEARVDHLEARRCNGFSVGGRVRAYELRDVDNKGFHAVITDCELSEISLVERPANQFAVVQSRFPANVQARLYDHMLDYVGVLRKFVTFARHHRVRCFAQGVLCPLAQRRVGPDCSRSHDRHRAMPAKPIASLRRLQKHAVQVGSKTARGAADP